MGKVDGINVINNLVSGMEGIFPDAIGYGEGDGGPEIFGVLFEFGRRAMSEDDTDDYVQRVLDALISAHNASERRSVCVICLDRYACLNDAGEEIQVFGEVCTKHPVDTAHYGTLLDMTREALPDYKDVEYQLARAYALGPMMAEESPDRPLNTKRYAVYLDEIRKANNDGKVFCATCLSRTDEGIAPNMPRIKSCAVNGPEEFFEIIVKAMIAGITVNSMGWNDVVGSTDLISAMISLIVAYEAMLSDNIDMNHFWNKDTDPDSVEARSDIIDFRRSVRELYVARGASQEDVDGILPPDIFDHLEDLDVQH